MASKTPVDCVIVGAGPTGLTLALELSRAGKSVLIFDRSAGPRPEHQSRALGILPPTLAILEPSQVTMRLLSEGLRIRRMDVSQNGAFRFTLDLTKAGGKFPFILTLPQGRTERILLEALAKYGVKPTWNMKATGLDNTGQYPVVLVLFDGKTQHIAGKRIVGCDGVHSAVRKSLGISFNGDKLPTVFSLADVTLNEAIDPSVAKADLVDGGFTAQLPLSGNSVRLIGAFPDVEQRPEFTSRIKEVGWHSDFTVTFRHVDKMSHGQVFLAGDAAHVHSPAGARGMNTGIADAAWLAWLICEGRESDYNKYRLPIARKIISQTRGFTDFILNRSPVMRFLVRFILPGLMRIPLVQKKAAQQLLAFDMPQPEWVVGNGL